MGWSFVICFNEAAKIDVEINTSKTEDLGNGEKEILIHLRWQQWKYQQNEV